MSQEFNFDIDKIANNAISKTDRTTEIIESTETQANGFCSSHAYLEYDGLSFEILYKGAFFDEEAYRDIFKKIQEDGYFEFEIKHGHGRDWE